MRFFPEYFSFLFDNISLCYICVCIFFPLSLYLLNVVVIVINYGLECITNLVIAYILYSAHILFDYKLVLVIFNLGV